jgi:hypothetical protein
MKISNGTPTVSVFKRSNSFFLFHTNLLHHCTFKTPTYGGVLSDNGNSYHALAEGRLRLEKCEGVKKRTKHDWVWLFASLDAFLKVDF